MKKLLQLGFTLAACSLTQLASAQNGTPDKTPGTPAPDTSPRPPESPNSDSARDRRKEHEAAPKPTSEEDFVKMATTKGIAELKVAQLGVDQANDAKIKELAQMLVKDHTAAGSDLKAIADSLGIKPGEQPDEKAEKEYKKLQATSGKEFDTAFLEHMSMCHNKGISWYEGGKKVAKSEPLIAYIDKVLPVLKTHASKIRELHDGTRTTTGAARPAKSDDTATETKR